MHTGAPSRAPRPRRVATPTFAPIPRPATAITCNRDRATALPRSCVSRCVDRRSMNPRNAAEGIQPSANIAKSLGNAYIATPQLSHSQESRKGQARKPAKNATEMDGAADGWTDMPFATQQANPRQNRVGRSKTALESRRDRWTQNHPADPPRDYRRARDRRKREGPPFGVVWCGAALAGARIGARIRHGWPKIGLKTTRDRAGQTGDRVGLSRNVSKTMRGAEKNEGMTQKRRGTGRDRVR